MRQSRAFAHTGPAERRSFGRSNATQSAARPKKAHFLGIKRILLHTSDALWS